MRTYIDQPSWVRIGLPGPKNHWERLQQALITIRKIIGKIGRFGHECSNHTLISLQYIYS